MTREQIEKLGYGDVIHYNACTCQVGPRGGVRLNLWAWRVTGKLRTWKRDATRFELPVNRGLYEYGLVMESNLSYWHSEEECPALAKANAHWASEDEKVAGLDTPTGNPNGETVGQAQVRQARMFEEALEVLKDTRSE